MRQPSRLRATHLAGGVKCPSLSGLFPRLTTSEATHKLVMGRVLKANVATHEGEFDGVRWAVALLADDHFGQAFVRGFLVVLLIPVNEHDHVGVLFDGARFA